MVSVGAEAEGWRWGGVGAERFWIGVWEGIDVFDLGCLEIELAQPTLALRVTFFLLLGLEVFRGNRIALVFLVLIGLRAFPLAGLIYRSLLHQIVKNIILVIHLGLAAPVLEPELLPPILSASIPIPIPPPFPIPILVTEPIPIHPTGRPFISTDIPITVSTITPIPITCIPPVFISVQ